MCTVDSRGSFYLNGKARVSLAFHCSSEGPTLPPTESFTSPTRLLYGSCQSLQHFFYISPSHTSPLLSSGLLKLRFLTAHPSPSLSPPPFLSNLLVSIFYTSSSFCPPLASFCISSFFALESLVLGCQYLQNSITYTCQDNSDR